MERPVAVEKPRASRAPAIASGVVIAIAVLGAFLYTRQGADDEVKRADAARAATEVNLKEEADKRGRAEALAREEAKKAAEDKAKALVLKKEEDERKKAELAAKKDAETKAQAEAEARRKSDEQAKAEAAKKAEEARQAAARPGRVFRDCEGCPEMVIVPAGSFLMGSPSSEEGRYSDEDPQHQVSIPRPFAAGKYEVTFDEWDACVRENGCSHNPGDAGWGRGRRPVFNVSWQDAKQYAEWLSRKTGKRYRLLTEAEWEYVARAGTATAFSSGAAIAASQANIGRSRNQTAPVGSYGANAFGLFDVHGTVWEWTEDCRNASYNGAPTNGSAWLTGDCSQRVVRGGSWHSDPRYLRSALRDGNASGYRVYSLGFRLARTLE